MSYAQALEEYYGMRIVNVRNTDIVEDVMRSKYLAANSRAAYKRSVLFV